MQYGYGVSTLFQRVSIDTFCGESQLCCCTSLNLALRLTSYAILVNVKILELHFEKSLLIWGFLS